MIKREDGTLTSESHLLKEGLNVKGPKSMKKQRRCGPRLCKELRK